MQFKRRGRALLALVMAFGLLAGACSDKDSVSSDGGGSGDVGARRDRAPRVTERG